ncbi:MAG: DUF1329 domain-containing protein [Janthinobacterium lividum]
MLTRILVAGSVAATLLTSTAIAQVTAQEAQQLKSNLTPLGAEKAGNQDGTIPAWTGGLTQLPSGLRPTDSMPDFFAGDAKRLTIDGSNVAQYASKLSDGTIRMLKTIKGYHIDIYPTHRTAAAPQWFYDGTFANATQAKLVDTNWVIDARTGIPFPIPKSGKQIAWNANLNWRGVQTLATTASYIVEPGGGPELAAVTHDARWEPYNDPSAAGSASRNYYLLARENTVGPPNRVGEAILSWGSFNEDKAPQITWQYLVGQRRLRKAPQVTYDGAYPDCGGVISVDELDVWNGPPDRYDMTIVGKKEIFIPYNNNKIMHDTSQSLLQADTINPNDVRWELHRVWVVDYDLATGKRHQIPHRRIYFDEDTWNPVLADDYDAQHTMWKTTTGFEYVNPSFPGTLLASQATYDLRNNGYCAERMVTSDHMQEHPVAPLVPGEQPNFYQPETLAAESAR